MLSIGLSLGNGNVVASGSGGGTSSAILSTTDKSAFLTRDGNFQAHSTGGGTNFQELIRANIQQANQKGHWEATINSFAGEASPTGSVGVALMDSLGNEAIPVGGNPGQTINGFSFVATNGTTTANLYYNGANHTVTLSSNPAIGDTLALDHDYTAHTVHVRYLHNGGATDDLGTITLTSLIPAVPFAAGSVFDFVDATHYDQFTINFGASAFAITPDAGFTYYA